MGKNTQLNTQITSKLTCFIQRDLIPDLKGDFLLRNYCLLSFNTQVDVFNSCLSHEGVCVFVVVVVVFVYEDFRTPETVSTMFVIFEYLEKHHQI